MTKDFPESVKTLKAWLDDLKIAVEPFEHCTKTWLSKNSDLKQFVDMKIKEYKIIDCKIISDVMHHYSISVRHRKGVITIMLMVICEEAAYCPSPEGEWGVNPVSWRKKNGI